ncbi:serine/threonine-protein kinase [Nocardia brevicatena]|uniref:serine/threonine-protein kinase n=1 Tax=Nocardia brevicatena TaxID=37327 RepID=UPI0002EAC704|nr:serine/threonine-protein kinase [Nocardia brevicatena]
MLNSGDVFAGFAIERLLGQGGMGSVYLARHPRLGKPTALKLLNRDLFADAAVRTRFEREADLAAHLDHPGIVAVYDRGAEGDQLWMCMQYIDGADAGTVNPLTLPPEKAVQIIEGVAEALDYAHGMGVLHRDVKPANILLARAKDGQGERVFLTDFGLARLRAETTRLTQTGMFTATLAFASPEQMTGGELDPRSDQYSLACALYWLLTGMAPFDSPNPADIIHGNLQLAPPPLAVKRPGLPSGLDAVLARAMAKHPAHRFATCAEFAAAARQALNTPVVPSGYAAGAGAMSSGYPGAPVAAAGAVPPRSGVGGGGAAPLSTDAAARAGGDGPQPERGAAPDGPTVAVVSNERPAAVGENGQAVGGTAYPPRPGGPVATGYGAPLPGPPGGYGTNRPDIHHFPPKRGGRAPLVAALVLVPIVVVALVLVGALFVVGQGDEDDTGPTAGPEGGDVSTLRTDPPSPQATDPVDRTRALFPTLLPQGTGPAGQGYQKASCFWYEPGDPVGGLSDVLETAPWEVLWECRRHDETQAHMSYKILTYDNAADARAVVEELPPHESMAGSKSGALYTSHTWSRPGPPGHSYTTMMVVSFESDPGRSNSLLYVSYSGEDDPGASALSPDIAVTRWWDDAPL